MGLYKNTNGVLSPIAGRGKAEYGASTVRKVTASFTVAGNNGASAQNILFDTPMPDADYLVSNPVITDANDSHIIFDVCNKTANGFRLYATNEYSAELTFTVEIYAFKLYTDNEYNNLLKITRPDKWTANTEISFGDNLYGQRFTGTVAKTTLASGGLALVSGVSKTACVFNWGGMIDMSGTSGNNWYNIGGSWDGTASDFRPLITNTSQVLRFYCETNQTIENYQYNIWMLYSK